MTAVEVVPTDAGVLTVTRGAEPMPADAIAAAALAIERQIEVAREALADLKGCLRTYVERTGKQSATFNGIRVALVSQTVVVCACHRFAIESCSNAGITPIEGIVQDVARRVLLRAVTP